MDAACMLFMQSLLPWLLAELRNMQAALASSEQRAAAAEASTQKQLAQARADLQQAQHQAQLAAKQADRAAKHLAGARTRLVLTQGACTCELMCWLSEVCLLCILLIICPVLKISTTMACSQDSSLYHLCWQSLHTALAANCGTYL